MRMASSPCVVALAAFVLAGCGQPEPAKTATANPAVFDPAVGGGPWFICDALDAPTVLEVARPTPAGEVTVVARDKAAEGAADVKTYALGGPNEADGAVLRTLSADGVAVGHVRMLTPTALADPSAATTPPVTEVKIGEATMSCRWLANTRLVGATTRRTAVITQEGEELVYRTFEYGDAKAQPVQPDAAQRSTTPTLEVRGGRVNGDNWAFVNGAFTYSVGEGGITTMENGRVTSGEPFAAAKLGAQPAG